MRDEDHDVTATARGFRAGRPDRMLNGMPGRPTVITLPEYLLELPSDEAARLIALSLLEILRAARGRLDDAGDPEALHDYRVALRRLRTALRTFRHQLRGSLRAGVRRRLRGLARSTRDSRDLEVHLAWTRGQADELPPRQRVGVDWLVSRLERRKLKSDRVFRRKIERSFERVTARLEQRLRVYRATIELDPERRRQAFGGVMSGRVRQLAGDLEWALAQIHTISDEETAHRARIAAKRLRYLLEPLSGRIPAVAPLVERLKSLQDELGDLHDSHVFVAELATAVQDAGLEHARRLSRVLRAWDAEMEPETEEVNDPRPGLIELARRLRRRGERAFEAVSASWLNGAADDFFRQVAELGAALAEPAAAHVEIERKYLLRELPAGVADVPPVEIEQGYLPGTRLVERLRQVRSEGEAAWYRTVKAGSGLARMELEEETSRDLFENIWPLTAGRRITKRRYRVPDGDLVWDVDQFLDRDLVLAEVELPSPGTEVLPPEWLAPYVEREVTQDPEYSNYRLAR